MIDGSEKRNRQLAFELQISHVCEKRSKVTLRKQDECCKHDPCFTARGALSPFLQAGSSFNSEHADWKNGQTFA